jgi:hypothetical protein
MTFKGPNLFDLLTLGFPVQCFMHKVRFKGACGSIVVKAYATNWKVADSILDEAIFFKFT